MLSRMPLGGMVAIVTPMDRGGQLNLTVLAKLVAWQIASGTQGIVVLGTTGEAPTIGAHERGDVIRCVIDAVAGRVPVIVGTGANSTEVTIALTQEAKALGADASLLVTPYYNKPTQEGLYLHYRKISESVDFPQIVYNVPGRTGCDLLPETVLRLAASCPNIVGIKEATGDLQRLRRLLAGCEREDFYFYSGDDITMKDFMLLGGHGVISVTANVDPERVATLCRFALSKDAVQADRLQAVLMPLHRQLFIESNPIPVKWLLCHMDKIPPGIRLPLTPLSASCQSGLIAAMVAVQQQVRV